MVGTRCARGWFPLALAAVALALSGPALAGCAKNDAPREPSSAAAVDESSTQAAGDSGVAPQKTAPTEHAPSIFATAPDTCALLTGDDVSRAIGAAMKDGVQDAMFSNEDGSSSGCDWYASTPDGIPFVTVVINSTRVPFSELHPGRASNSAYEEAVLGDGHEAYVLSFTGVDANWITELGPAQDGPWVLTVAAYEDSPLGQASPDKVDAASAAARQISGLILTRL